MTFHLYWFFANANVLN